MGDVVQDVAMGDGPGQEDENQLPLSNDEQRALALYDQLQQLRVELAIINAQASYRQERDTSRNDGVSEDMQRQLLDARANFKLRNDAVISVMTANPILKAVHNGTDASPAERDLLPLVEQRDERAKAVAKQSTDAAILRADMTEVQSESARVIRRNVQLTSELFELAEEVNKKQAAQLDDAEMQERIAGLEREMKQSRRNWRVIKGVASGIIAGSGVDWARDSKLRDIVLDAATED